MFYLCSDCVYGRRVNPNDKSHPTVKPNNMCGEFAPRPGSDMHDSIPYPDGIAMCELKEYQCWRYPPIVEVATDA